jgi:hypothetical protein
MVIVISAKQGGGKSTLAKAIIDKYNGQVVKFADPLYEMHEAIWNVLEPYGVPREKKSGDFLQWVGTEFGRKRDQDIWVNIAKRRIAKIMQSNPNAVVIIDDCRFENEFYALDEFEPLKIRLECDRDVRKVRADSWRDNENHPSETSLDAIAASGSFDLYFDTQNNSVDNILNVIETEGKLNETK